MKLKTCTKCNKETFIYKNITEDGIRYRLCKQCAMSIDTPKIKQRSTKKVIQDSEYSLLRMKYLVKHSKCEAKLSVCTRHATDIHHKAGRGINTNNVDTFMAICRACHSYLHLNVQFAREKGWLI